MISDRSLRKNHFTIIKHFEDSLVSISILQVEVGMSLCCSRKKKKLISKSHIFQLLKQCDKCVLSSVV